MISFTVKLVSEITSLLECFVLHYRTLLAPIDAIASGGKLPWRQV
jgi:hypothetical protein